MSYEITLVIDEESPEGRSIETVVENEHLSREEAALKLLAASNFTNDRKANAGARRIIGAFNKEASLMDEVMELAMNERRCRNENPLHA